MKKRFIAMICAAVLAFSAISTSVPTTAETQPLAGLETMTENESTSAEDSLEELEELEVPILETEIQENSVLETSITESETQENLEIETSITESETQESSETETEIQLFSNIKTVKSAESIEQEVTVQRRLDNVLYAKMDSDGQFVGLDKYYSIVVDALVNEKISLDSTECKIKDANGNTVSDLSLTEGLYYSKEQNGSTGIYQNKTKVDYLMLEETELGDIVVRVYAAGGELLSGGTLLLVSEAEMAAAGGIEIVGIQTTVKDGLIAACAVSSGGPFHYTRPGVEGDRFSLADITGIDEFYYSEPGKTLAPENLIPCTEVELARENGEMKLFPVDASGEPVIGATVYMVRDHLYSFDINLYSLVNEHSEDDGDAFLWRGNQWYNVEDRDTPEADDEVQTVDPALAGRKKVDLTITGRIGDTFTPHELGQNMIYVAIGDARVFNMNWMNMSLHASEGGSRNGKYIINDFIVLNTYEDKANYFEIYQNEDGEAALRIKMPASGVYVTLTESGDTYAEADLYVSRDSLIREQILAASYTPTHVQLRVPTNIMVDHNGYLYSGNFTFLKAYVTATYINDDGDVIELIPENTEAAIDDNELITVQQESKSVSWSVKTDGQYPTGADEIFDSERVIVSITYYLKGTMEPIEQAARSIITYTEENPYVHTLTLTSSQLRDAFYACPNQSGYDVVLDVNYDMKMDMENGDRILLTKIWDDKMNFYGIRSNAIHVTLQRSKDGVTWEDFDDNKITITGAMDAAVWTKEIHGLETYLDDQGQECQYQYKIYSEDPIPDADNARYEVSISKDGLTITNTAVPKTTSVSGEKKWFDHDGTTLEEEYQPDWVYVVLLQDDKIYGFDMLKKAEGWQFSFTDLPRYNGTRAYDYSVCEVDRFGKIIRDGSDIILDQITYTVGISNDQKGFVTIANTRDNAKPVDVSLVARKSVLGGGAPAIEAFDGHFSFTIKAISDNAENVLPDKVEVTNTNNEVIFGEVTYTAPGIYKYEISETGTTAAGTNPGVSLSSEKIQATVTVTKNKETNSLEAKVVYVGENGYGDRTFINTYRKPGGTQVQLEGEKLLDGRRLENGQFTFTLVPQGEAPGTMQQVTNDGDGKISFEAILIEENVEELYWGTAGNHKVFTYVITEEPGDSPYITYDSGSITVKVTVEKTAENKLDVVDITYKKGNNDLNGIVFENTYNKPAGTTVQFNGKKVLNGRNLEAGQFTFTLEPQGNAPGTKQQVTNDADGNITFSPISIEETEGVLDWGLAGGSKVFTYVITETKGVSPYITYDEEPVTVNVTVEKTVDNKLKVTDMVYLKAGGAADGIAFENTYNKPEGTSIRLEGRKLLSGRKLEEGQFTFILEPLGNAPGTKQQITNNADGKIMFDEIPVEESAGALDWGLVGSRKVFSYMITEVKGEYPYYRYDNSLVTANVTVEKTADNKLEVVGITYLDNGMAADGIEFENAYLEAEGTVLELAGQKILGNGELREGQFTFTLTPQGEAPGTVQTVTNTSSGEIAFEPIPIEEDSDISEWRHGEKAKVFTYVITERNDGAENYTYDSEPVTVKVTVVRTDENHLEVKEIYYEKAEDAANGIWFVNYYEPPTEPEESTPEESTPEESTPEESTPEESTPEESSPEESSPEESTPEESTPEESTPEESSPEESTPEESTPEESTPEESTPEESTPEESTPEESTPEESTPEESSPEESTPEESTPEESTPEESTPEESTPEESTPEESTPSYEAPEPVTLKLEGKKTLSGKTLKAGQFTFILTPQDDAPGKVQKVNNKADGSIVFDEIEFKEIKDVLEWDEGKSEKTFTYVVSEQDDNKKYYTYDAKSVTVYVTVKKAEENRLEVVDVTYKKDGKAAEGIEFKNYYKVDNSVETGDDTNLLMYVGIAGVSLMSLTVLLVLRRRRTEL